MEEEEEWNIKVRGTLVVGPYLHGHGEGVVREQWEELEWFSAVTECLIHRLAMRVSEGLSKYN